MSGEPLIILLVEDNQDHAELVRRNLDDVPWPVRLVHLEDGEAALRYLRGTGTPRDRQFDHLPHVILLDLRLPRIDGLEVLRVVKGSPELKRIPVVILTTSDAERDLAAACAHHAHSYLTKPFDFGQFASLLRDLSFPGTTWNRPPQWGVARPSTGPVSP